MKILATADWHLGSFRGPEENGINLRSQNTIRCLEEMVCVAQKEKPELILVSGDIFDKAEIWQGRSHKEVLQARKIILDLSENAKHVIVMRGTPNHDSSEAFSELEAHFEFMKNVEIVTAPKVIPVDGFDIAVLPGFDRGVYRVKFPGLSKEEENEAFTHELSNIVLGLKAQCNPERKSILMSHYTVPGCNTESGQVMMLTQFEPILPLETLQAAEYDLVALGHIHRPQAVPNLKNCYYSGAINAMNFNDEGQERGFWIHELTSVGWVHDFHKTPYREFLTIRLNDNDIGMINTGDYDIVGTEHWRGEIDGKIVRIIYSCSYENKKALNRATLEKELLEDAPMMNETGNPLVYPFGFEPTLHKYRMDYPGKLKMGNNIFVGAMSDIFGKWVPDSLLDDMFSVCAQYPVHNYLFLTKYPQRYEQYCVPDGENMWYGATITKENEIGRVMYLPGERRKFVSIEPLLEDIEPENNYPMFKCIDWVIIGAETGRRKDKTVPQSEWVRKIVSEADKNRIPVFMKDSLIPIVGEENMRRDFPGQLQHSEISPKMKKKLFDTCAKCKAHLKKSDMITLIARSGRGEHPKQFGFMCKDCFKDFCQNYGLDIPELANMAESIVIGPGDEDG